MKFLKLGTTRQKSHVTLPLALQLGGALGDTLVTNSQFKTIPSGLNILFKCYLGAFEVWIG